VAACAALLAWPARARADWPPGSTLTAQSPVCLDVPRGLGDGPIVIGFFEGDLGTGHRACPRSELTAWGRAGAVIDPPGFYGSVDASLLVGGSWAIRQRGQLEATLELLHYQLVRNASLASESFSLGFLTVGGSAMVLDRAGVALTPYARLLFPTSTAEVHARTMGAEGGLALQWRPRRVVALHHVFAGDVTGSVSAAPGFVRGGALLLVGVEYMPVGWFELVFDIDSHFGARAAVDRVALAPALRFRPIAGLGIEVAATAPVAGAERRVAMIAVRLRWEFGR
jgi:hypothetical protein